MTVKNKIDLRLYVITDKKLAGVRSVIDVVHHAIQGGATMIQLRDKNASDEELITLGKELIKITKGKISLVVNDNIKVAMAIGAQGIHLGQKDMSALKAKEMIGDTMILGVSAGSVEEAMKAEEDGADYIGAGPVFPTSTKPDADLHIGLNGLRSITDSVSIPVVAIGGINAKNAGKIAEIADGIAVVSAVMAAKYPKKAAWELFEIVNMNKNK